MSNHANTFGQFAPVGLTLPRRPQSPCPVWPRPCASPCPVWPRPCASPCPVWPRRCASTVIVVLERRGLITVRGLGRAWATAFRRGSVITWAADVGSTWGIRGTDPQQAEAAGWSSCAATRRPGWPFCGRWDVLVQTCPWGALVRGCGGWESKITVVGPSLVDHRRGTRRCVSDWSRSRSGDHHEGRTGSRGG